METFWGDARCSRILGGRAGERSESIQVDDSFICCLCANTAKVTYLEDSQVKVLEVSFDFAPTVATGEVPELRFTCLLTGGLSAETLIFSKTVIRAINCDLPIIGFAATSLDNLKCDGKSHL